MVLRERSVPRAYEIEKRIAVGGMGEIYEGRAVDLEKRVAIKRMLKGDDDEELTELFFREVAVAAMLEHPNVVEVFDAAPMPHDLFLIMEFVDGPSLAEILGALKRTKTLLPIEIACGIVSQIARGLAHAHERALPDGTPLGIVHRDIAPENVLITRTGLPKIVDFGLATLAGHRITEPGTIRGRPRCLSPELARGEKIDARSDIFSLGGMLFELASGEHLYPEGAPAALLWKVIEGSYASIEDRLVRTDPDLVDIIKTALTIDPRQRFRSAREMERSLDNFRAQRGLRIESGAIAAVVEKVWPDVLRTREEKGDGDRGELEGRRLLVPADSIEGGEMIEPRSHSHRSTAARASTAALEEGPGGDTTPRPFVTPSAHANVSNDPTAPGNAELGRPRSPARAGAERDRLSAGGSEVFWIAVLVLILLLSALAFASVWFSHGGSRTTPRTASARTVQFSVARPRPEA